MCIIKYVNKNSSEFDSIVSIRKAVFISEQGADKNEEFDHFDDSLDTLYSVVSCDNIVVGTGRLVKHNNKYKIGRIAILSEYRGRHLGEKIVKSLVEASLEKGAKELFIDAQIHAISFYEKLGFKKLECENIIDRGIIHTPMKLSLENNYEK